MGNQDEKRVKVHAFIQKLIEREKTPSDKILNFKLQWKNW